MSYTPLKKVTKQVQEKKPLQWTKWLCSSPFYDFKTSALYTTESRQEFSDWASSLDSEPFGTKAELLQLNRTQFSTLGIFVSEKVRNPTFLLIKIPRDGNWVRNKVPSCSNSALLELIYCCSTVCVWDAATLFVDAGPRTKKEAWVKMFLFVMPFGLHSQSHSIPIRSVSS